MPTCPNGHALPDPSAKYCPDCGASIPLTPERQRLSMSATGPTCAIHPDQPSAGACARCGSFACATCLQPDASGALLCVACRARVPDMPLPWDRRRELGTLRAYWLTCRDLMLHPDATFSRVRAEGTIGESLYFTFLSSLAGYATTVLIYAVILAAGAAGLAFAPAKERIGLGVGALVAGAAVVIVLLMVVAPIVSVIVTAGLDHLVLRIAGANPRSWEVTLRANALSTAPQIIGLIPFCGAYVFPIWSIVLRIFAYRGMHRTTGWKAALGALLLPVICVCAVFSFYGVLIASLLGSGKLR